MDWDTLSPEDKQDYLDAAVVIKDSDELYKDIDVEELAKMLVEADSGELFDVPSFDDLSPEEQAAFEHLAQVFKKEWEGDALGDLDLDSIMRTVFESLKDGEDDYAYLFNSPHYDKKHDAVFFLDDANNDGDIDVMGSDTDGDGNPDKIAIDAKGEKEKIDAANIVESMVNKAKADAKNTFIPGPEDNILSNDFKAETPEEVDIRKALGVGGAFKPETPEEEALLGLDSTGLHNAITSALVEHRF